MGGITLSLLDDTAAFIAMVNEGRLASADWETLRNAIRVLMTGSPIVVQSLSASYSLISRARRLNRDEHIANIRALGPPSHAQCNTYGRCNRPTNAFLYAGANIPLLFSEIGVKEGDRVGLLHLRPARDLKLLNLGAIDLYRRTSGYCMLDEKIKAFIGSKLVEAGDDIRLPLLDAFIADYFSRPGSPNIYKLTSAFADVVLRGAPNLDGIVYDSVNHHGGKCYGIRGDLFPAVTVPVAMQIVSITADHGYGIFEYSEEAFSNSFVGGKIVWEARGR